MSAHKSMLEGFLKGRFSMVLASLALLFFVVPIIPGDRVFVDKVLGVFSLAVLISCLRAISESRRFFIFMVVLSIIEVSLGSTQIFSSYDNDLFITLVLGFKLTFFVLVFFSIMRNVLSNSRVTTDKICGAITAYLLMGIAWAIVFSLINHLNPGSFDIPIELVDEEPVNSLWSIYFSFTTLTTLGYGDIAPKYPAAQVYAFMEAACGQIFLAVIIARLVALQIVHADHAQQS